MQTELLDAPTTEATVASKYGITKAAIEQAVEETKSITVSGPEDKKGIALARESRISLGKIRTTIEHKRKELKADALEYGRKVDSVAKELTAIVEPAEDRLRELEETAKREQERLAKEAEEACAVELQRRTKLAFAVRWQIQPAMLNMLSATEFESAYAIEKERFDADEAARALAAKMLKEAQDKQAEIEEDNRKRQAEIDRREVELKEQQRKIDEAAKEAATKRRNWRASCLVSIGSTTPVDELMYLTDEEFESHLVVMRLDAEKIKEQQAREDAIRKEQEAKVAKRREILNPFGHFSEAYILQLSDEQFAELVRQQHAIVDERRAAEAVDLEARIQREADERLATIERARVAEEERKRANAEKAAAAAKRKAARAPDREKVLAFMEAVDKLPVPTLSAASHEQSAKMSSAIADLVQELQEIAESLE